jgi:CelD/BcsL family acetyltransferase involved in cellulose biosynthesis
MNELPSGTLGIIGESRMIQGPPYDERSSSLSLEVVRDVQSFASLHGEWNALVRASSAGIFQTFEWQSLWWKHLGESRNRSLHILLMRSHGELVGIAPFFISTSSFLGLTIYKILQLMGCGVTDRIRNGLMTDYGVSDYLDLIALPEFEVRVAEHVVSYLLAHASDYDGVEFANVPQDSILLRRVVPQLQQSDVPCKISQQDICPRLRIPSSMLEYLQSVKPNVRRRLSQAQRAVDSFYTIRMIQTSKELRQSFQDLIALHQKRWNHLGYPGLFADPRFGKYLEEVSQAFLRNGWLWYKTAEVNGSCVAARLGFALNDCLYDYISGLDDESPIARRRPGLALLLEMISDAIRWKFQTLHLLRGDEKYKFEFTMEAAYNWRICLTQPGIQNTLREQVYRLIQFLRRLLFLFFREWILLRVQYREHGRCSFVLHYVLFRSRRIAAKFIDHGNQQ